MNKELSVNTTLSHYRIVSKIGAGGMGEVYRARDSKLNREVAIKVLPEAFAQDPERVARFQREAQVLASLNHPNIAAIYGLEESDGIRALVMELVEGPTLADRIAAGPIPFDEVLTIARQIADALEVAHERGVIHRDLKPANVKVTPDDKVKVLDFGLAKITSNEAPSNDLSHSPTVIQGTQAGMILGTAAYMSPEQARGRAVDRRADIWSFGAVLFEMLTARRAFDGDDVSITLANVLKEDVRWEALPADLPEPLRRLLRRCLEKDPKRRLSWIGEARLTLDDPAAGDPVRSSIAPPQARWSRALPWAVAGVLGVTLAAALMSWAPWRETPSKPPRLVLASIGADASLVSSWGSAVVSPDGSTLAFAARSRNQIQLYIRRLEQLKATAVPGADGALGPVFSPDSQHVAFFADGKLKRVSVAGGAVVLLCDAPSPSGLSWAADTTVLFVSKGRLQLVASSGGAAREVGVPTDDDHIQVWPQALPGGRMVLYSENQRAVESWESANIVVAPLGGGPSRIVMQGGYYGRYVPSGHLIFFRQGGLWAVPFDLDRLAIAGEPVTAIEGASSSVQTGLGRVSVSDEGTLVYEPDLGQLGMLQLKWMTRDGKTAALDAIPSEWQEPRFSPDGKRLALSIASGDKRNIWVYELARDTLMQLTFEKGHDRTPVWSPDGRYILFSSDRASPGITNLYVVNADGAGSTTRLTESAHTQVASSWHPSGKFIAFQENRPGMLFDLMMLPVDGLTTGRLTPGTPSEFLATPGAEVYPKFSPDGRWVAYFSGESNFSRLDLFVRPFPGPGGRWRISTEGGSFPHWSASSSELLFLQRNQLMVASYSVAGESFRADKPQLWSPIGVRMHGYTDPYDLHPDGQRLVGRAEDGSLVSADKIVLMSNFFEYLRKIAPARK